jgi:uncharacterized protein (TIGR03437 family)
MRPNLQWYKTVSGSAPSTTVSVASDSAGNLYVAGHTYALDLPTANAAQSSPGGSPITVIDASNGAAQKIFNPVIAGIATLTADPGDPQTLYATNTANLLRSLDAGATWTVLPTPADGAINAVTVDPTNSSTLYLAGGALGAFKSLDGGGTWQAINNGIPVTNNQGTDIYHHLATIQTINVFRIWIDLKAPANLIEYGSAGVYRTANGGTFWTASVTGFGGGIAYDPFTSGVVYASGYSHAQISTDEGQTWNPLPNVPSGFIVADPFHKGVLYVANGGISRSTDGGQTWSVVSTAPATAIAADPAKPILYAYLQGSGVVSSSDGFATTAVLVASSDSVNQTPITQLLPSGGKLFSLAKPTTDIFVTKLDPSGNVLFSTYFGGSANDTLIAMAIAPDGSAYLTGTTASADFPTTPSSFAPAFPAEPNNIYTNASFLMKINPNGSLAWSTFFTGAFSAVAALAVDSAGNPYLTGSSEGGLPTTPNAYQPQFIAQYSCLGSVGYCPSPSNAFVTKFNAQGSALVYSTYIAYDSTGKNGIAQAGAIALDSNGNVFLATGLSSYQGTENSVTELDATGSKLLVTSPILGPIGVNALTVESSGSILLAGSAVISPDLAKFPATPGAFQSQSTGSQAAFVLRLDPALQNILAATLLGGEAVDSALSLAIDPATGSIIVGGFTDSLAFPTRTPLQGPFSTRNGFLAAFDPTLSQLLFSTYLGDARSYSAIGAVPDGQGNILLAGSTLEAVPGSYSINDPGFANTVPNTVIANRISLVQPPPVRLDSATNLASQLAAPIAPGEAIALNGSGFGSGSQVSLNGSPLPTVSVSPTQLVAVIPTSARTGGTLQFTVTSGGSTSNLLQMPATSTSPAIFAILNADGSLNSASNPAAQGSAISLLVNGAGPVSIANGYAVTPQTAAVFVDGFYANGIAATQQQVAAYPGALYAIGVYIPIPSQLVAQNPNLLNFVYPPQDPVNIYIGATESPNFTIYIH